MNRLKLVGLVVLVLTVIVGVYFLRGESAPAEQMEKQRETVSKLQANVEKAKADADSTAGKSAMSRASEFENRKAEEIARTAESLKTMYRNPATPEAAKARQSLLKLPEVFAKSAPGSAAEKEAIAKFLKKSHLSNKIRLMRNIAPDLF